MGDVSDVLTELQDRQRSISDARQQCMAQSDTLRTQLESIKRQYSELMDPTLDVTPSASTTDTSTSTRVDMVALRAQAKRVRASRHQQTRALAQFTKSVEAQVHSLSAPILSLPGSLFQPPSPAVIASLTASAASSAPISGALAAAEARRGAEARRDMQAEDTRAHSLRLVLEMVLCERACMAAEDERERAVRRGALYQIRVQRAEAIVAKMRQKRIAMSPYAAGHSSRAAQGPYTHHPYGTQPQHQSQVYTQHMSGTTGGTQTQPLRPLSGAVSASTTQTSSTGIHSSQSQHVGGPTRSPESSNTAALAAIMGPSTTGSASGTGTILRMTGGHTQMGGGQGRGATGAARVEGHQQDAGKSLSNSKA
ncbi:hypothetical protein KIPB_000934 [Kipferlia bialata]|uniref:Uncharacterized protein n=1 Tax=Kipferlia bialata TaxID=797122 RepID=A0A9K3CP97_9EUKA|nr:hypothetical protein KIPB_000934 [Kipferlia bialata]|eukprot:g934.t1